MNDSNQPTTPETPQLEPQVINTTAEETADAPEAVVSQTAEAIIAKDENSAEASPPGSAKAGAPGRDSSRGAQARPERPERTEREKADRAEQRAERMAEAQEVAEKAWKLYSGEIEEEGIELIDDSDAEKLALRCFKIAEIFVKARLRRLNQAINGGGDENSRSQNSAQHPRHNQPNQSKGAQSQQNQQPGSRQQNQSQNQKQGQRQNQPNQGKGGQNNGQNQPRRSEPQSVAADETAAPAASVADKAPAPEVVKAASVEAAPVGPETPAATAAE